MLRHHPCLLGLLTGIATHVAPWLALYAFSLLSSDIGAYISLLLLLARLALFFCLNLNALGSADTRLGAYRFAGTFILPLIPLLGIEWYALSLSEVLSFLDPHSSWFTGIAFVLLWFAIAIEGGIELLIAALQTLIHTYRARRASKS